LNLELFSERVGYFVVNHSNFSFGVQMTKLKCVGLVEIAVDNLESCSAKVGENIILSQESVKSTTTASNSISGGGDKSKLWFPFAEGIPFAATLWLGAEGFHMTVNGRHISSFQYRQVLTPSPIIIPNGLKSMKIFNFNHQPQGFSNVLLQVSCFRNVHDSHQLFSTQYIIVNTKRNIKGFTSLWQFSDMETDNWWFSVWLSKFYNHSSQKT